MIDVQMKSDSCLLGGQQRHLSKNNRVYSSEWWSSLLSVLWLKNTLSRSNLRDKRACSAHPVPRPSLKEVRVGIKGELRVESMEEAAWWFTHRLMLSCLSHASQNHLPREWHHLHNNNEDSPPQTCLQASLMGVKWGVGDIYQLTFPSQVTPILSSWQLKLTRSSG